jgi:hypothetical protein
LCGGDGGENGVDLVGRIVLVAADLELDESRVAVLRDLTGVAGLERRADAWTAASAETRSTTSAIAESNAGVPTRCERLSTRTFSAAGCLNPASRISFMRPDSPGPPLFWSMVVVPTMPPSMKARTTKASHPNVAAFQCAALQRPMRAARFVEVVSLPCMPFPPWSKCMRRR